MIGVSNITNRTDPNSLRSRVFVGNLNTLHMQKPQLEAIFSKFGAIIGISVHKGYAFIQYANEAHARAAVKAEDMNTYYGMKLDVTIASEPKNRKRGRPAATQNACTSAQNFLDLALQAQALAAVGGQFSHLGFSNNAAPPLSLTASQYPAAAAAAAAAAANLTGLIPTMNVMNSGVPPLLGQATMGGGGGGSQKSPSGTGYKSLMPNPHRGSGLNSLSASSSSAKRTRLETGSTGGGGGGGGSVNSSGLPAGAAAARSANLVSLVTPKQDPFPPNTRVAPRTSTTSSSSASLCVTSRLQSATSRPSTASNSHSNSTQKYTHGIAAKFSDMKVGGGSQEADRRQNSNGSAHAGGAESQQPGQRQQQQQQQRSHPYSEDILICGQCRQLFESVDVLIAHKMAGCSINKENGLTCRCKRNGEPDCLDCAYCGDTFSSAWELVSHCHTEHSLTIYAIPSQPPSPSSTAATSETARPTSPKRQHVSKDLQRGRGCCSSSSSSSVLSRPAGPAAVSASPPAKAEEQTEEEEEDEEEEEYDFEVNTPQADVCEEEEEVAAAAAATAVSEADGSTRSRGGSVDEQDGSNQAAESEEAPMVEHDSPVEEEEVEEDNEESSEEAAQDQESEQQQQHGKQEEAESTQNSNGLVEDSAKDGAEALTEVNCAAAAALEEDGKVPRPDRQQHTSFRRERRGSEHGRNETCTDDEEGEEYVADRSG